MNIKVNTNSLLYRIAAVFMIAMLMLASMPVAVTQAAPLKAVGVGADFGAANVAIGIGAMTAITGNYTVGAGTNRVLVVAVLWESQGNGQTTSFTSGSYGGQALTSLTLNGSNATRNRVWVGYLKQAGIAAATSTALNLNFANSTAPNGWVVKAAWFNGIDQTTPINAFVNGGNENPGSATHNFGGNLAVINGGRAIYFESTNGGFTYTAPAGYAENFDANDPGNNFSFTAGSKAITANGNENPNIVQSGAQRYRVTAISLNPAPTAPVAPAFTSGAATTFTVGATNSFTVAASGNPAPTFSFTGALPTGVTLNATTGVLSGTPAAGTVGVYPIVITATGTAPNATQNFTLTVQKANTTTTINSDTPDPSPAGTNVVVNYTVASAGNTIARTGNVTVGDGVNSCTGTAAAGTCTLALTTGGSRPLTATYAGDANFNGSASAAAPHTVSASYTINASAGAGGTITPTGAVAVAGGANQTFNSAPNPTFILSDVLVDGTTVGRANSYTFNAVAAGHTIASSFNGGWFAPTASANVLIVPIPANAYTSNNNYAVFSSLGERVDYHTFGIPAIPAGSTINGIEVGIEGYCATVNRNVEIQLSWNGGTNFTAITPARTTTLLATDSTVILGGTADTWGRTWANTDFTNFRVRATSTGGGTSPVYIDQLQVKVTYTLPLAAPTITSPAPVGGTEGTAYSHTYTATGTTPITFSYTGTLPPGLTLTPAGVLSGTPTAAGTYTGIVTAANGVAPNATQAFSITIAAIAPTITSAAPSNGVQGVAYSHTYTANGTAPITFSVIGSLPPGLTLTSAGVLSGTPTAIGTYSGVVTATNGIAPDATQNFSITISMAPSITSANSTSFTLGSAGSFTVATTGFPLPTLSVTGVLPSGVTFTPATGVLAGTPATGTSGTYPLTFTATNGVSPDAVQNFTLIVSQGPSITSANNTTFSVGLPGTFTVTAIGVPAPTLSMTGTLPGGVTFTPATGILAGSPNVGTAGVYPLTFNAVNGTSPDASQSFTLTIKNGPVIVPNGINSVPDTGNGSISNNENILASLNITKLIVKFDHDVYNVPSGDPNFAKSVVNPANYMLVQSSSGTFVTLSCAGGVVSPDVARTADSVTYSNGGGAGPFVATLNFTTLPINSPSYYQLYVCGTTSIADAADINLELAGDGITPGTDFRIGFRVRTSGSGGGGGGNGNTRRPTNTDLAGAALIPVTGFAPNKVTALPAQPANKAYATMNGISIEIPTLGIKYPIVGAMFDKNNWDLTWLKDSVAYLEGSAYPTLTGNTVLTAHVVDANDNLGPFSDIKGLKSGQKINIHAYGQVYVYQVQENRLLLPSSVSTVFKHEEEYSLITLVTCEDYNAKTGLYNFRRMVRAVLVSVVPEKK